MPGSRTLWQLANGPSFLAKRPHNFSPLYFYSPYERHPLVPSVVVLGQDSERDEARIRFNNRGHDIRAGALEVKSLPIKGEVVGVAHSPAGGLGLGHTYHLTVLHHTVFLLTAFMAAQGIPTLSLLRALLKVLLWWHNSMALGKWTLG
uniref:Uncharacterized protein n=1 Tax=Oncorhynchus kisutch TaxID=8019 RepID=A0A8C7EZ66_ONCKI